MKATIIDIDDLFFFSFFHVFGVLCVKTRAKIAQNCHVFASKIEDASLVAFFFRSSKTSLFNCIVYKPCGKRPLSSPEKSSEGTLYSVPNFGDQIDISLDVTIYPFLVIVRTGKMNFTSSYSIQFNSIYSHIYKISIYIICSRVRL